MSIPWIKLISLPCRDQSVKCIKRRAAERKQQKAKASPKSARFRKVEQNCTTHQPDLLAEPGLLKKLESVSQYQVIAKNQSSATQNSQSHHRLQICLSECKG